MAFQFLTQYDSPAYTPGRQGHRIKYIVVHHWGVDGQSFMGVVNWLCRSGSQTSAHYVLEDGKVACIVDLGNTAWHAGNWEYNLESIGIECRPEMTDGDLRTLAELIAEIWKVYGKLPVIGHKDIVPTACPGRYYNKLGYITQMAENILANGEQATEKPAPTPAPKKPTIPSGVEMVRYAGEDRNETAEIIAKAYKRTNLVVIKQDSYADGFSASVMIKDEDANLVFEKTANVKGKKTFGIGGIKGDEKIEGNTRYDTNYLILKRYLKDKQSILVASGRDWADGASALGTQRPILLVSDFVNKKQINLLSKFDGLEFTILGSVAAVSKTVEDQLAEIGTVTRLDGKDRYQTSALTAKHFHPKANTIICINAWADAVAAAQIGDYPILLLSDHRNDDAKEYVRTLKVKKIFAIGSVLEERIAELFE